MQYDVQISVMISPRPDGQGHRQSGSTLFHSRNFVIVGERFSDVAESVDAVYDAVELVCQNEERDTGR